MQCMRQDAETRSPRCAGPAGWWPRCTTPAQAAARPGVTTADLDQVAREVLEPRGARSNFLNYHGFPAVICTSPNDVIVHGIPGAYRLEEGDILSIDCGAIIEGYHGDAALTIPIGEVAPRPSKPDRGHRARACRPASSSPQRQPPLRHRPRGADGGRGGRLLGRPGVRRPRDRHGHARGAPDPELRRPPGTGHQAQGRPRASRSSRWSTWAGPRPSCSTTAGRSSPPTAAVGPLRAHHRRHRRRPGGAHRPRLS